MADTLNKLLSSTTYTIPAFFQEGAAIAVSHIDAAFDGDDRNEIVTLGGLYECLVSSKDGHVHILVNKIGAKKYVFDKVYTNRTWATKRFLNFVASIDTPERVLINAPPALDLEEQHAHGPIAKWVQEDVTTIADDYRAVAREACSSAVVDTKMLGHGEFKSRWTEVTAIVTVAWETPFDNGILGRIEPADGAWIAKLTFGDTTLERDAETEREAKETVCSMASLLEAWKF